MAESYPRLCASIAASASKVGVAVHRAGYRALEMDWTYVAFSLDDTEAAVAAIRALGIRGCGVTMPHKESVLPLLDRVDDDAAAIGAVNTIVNDDGHLTGYNTDWLGATRALEAVTSLDGAEVVLLGAGGAGRAVAYGLKRAGARVTVRNRTEARAAQLADELGLAGSGGLEGLAGSSFDVLVNTTSVGYRDPEASPVTAPLDWDGKVVLDAVAEPHRTRLLRDAEAGGAIVVPGTRMRLLQAGEQFRLYTGKEPPLDAMETALLAATGGGG